MTSPVTVGATVTLRPGREKSAMAGHPWLYRGAIRTVEGEPAAGDIVCVRAHDGRFLAIADYSPHSQIALRALSWRDEPLDEGWWRARLSEALARRAPFHAASEAGALDAYRLIHAESDYLPGLIVDRYGDHFALQALTAGMERRKPLLAQLLGEIWEPAGIYDRSDAPIRRLEGLPTARGLLWGEEPPARIPIQENMSARLVDMRGGQKTGDYLDQRDNRFLLYDWLASMPEPETLRMLDVCCYSGGFTLAALAAGLRNIALVDSGEAALALARANIAHCGAPEGGLDFRRQDAFDALAEAQERGERYDVIVLDPPRFASNKSQIPRATRGYKELNRRAFLSLKPGGLLLTCSCSGAIDARLFQQVIFGALVDAGRQAQILRPLSAGADHPIALTFPQGAYLKGLLLRVE